MKTGPAAQPFWSIAPAELMQTLGTGPEGLSGAEAEARRRQYAADFLTRKKSAPFWSLLLAQFKSPIILILVFAALLSVFLHDTTDAVIILAIVALSGLLGFWQEHGASTAVQKLLALVEVRVAVLRDGRKQEVPLDGVLPGDVVVLAAGGMVPGDALLLEEDNLFVDEAALTGETYPVEKSTGILPADTALAQRRNCLFMGTHVVSGTAKALVVAIGRKTELGRVADRLRLRRPETEFEKGIKEFGYLLLEVTLLLVLAIFAINVLLDRQILQSLLFSLALAVGLTPQLLPAIISINLAHGAKQMAQRRVIVKRLASIENFGSMEILFSDKTGTITEGVVRVKGFYDAAGQENDQVLYHAYLNAFFEKGYQSPIDEAIRRFGDFDLTAYEKVAEIPYDFLRKRLSVLIAKGEERLLVTKGALTNVLEVCTRVATPAGETELAGQRAAIEAAWRTFGTQGFRTLGIARRCLAESSGNPRDLEQEMTFLGFLVLHDPLKPGIVEAVRKLKELGVSLKILTGDNRLVAAALGREIGLEEARLLSGPEVRDMSDAALMQRAQEVDIFAEVEPNQKERIVLAARKSGRVVGFMGDGINDAPALHAADVGISVDSAVDVAKEAADIILLQKNLSVLLDGVREGRVTFSNTLKYIFMATSANFGNMFSMAGASLFLPFLPLLPKQILLTNLITDFPEMAIATDRVDPESVEQPRRLDSVFIKRFMVTFGLLSSLFDYLTFGALLWLRVDTPQFRSGWFVESVVSAIFIVLVVRTRQPFYRSRPGRGLLVSTLLAGAAAVVIPFSPLAGLFAFQGLAPRTLMVLALIILLYVWTAEVAKRWFYRRVIRRLPHHR